VRTLRFDTDPRIAGDGPRRTWGEWKMMLSVPVIAVTDLGIAPRRVPANPTAAWLEVAERARRAETSIAAFVPWSSDRWPAPLASAMTLIEWDRTTTVTTLGRRAGRAR
jgi:hypothetical protein